MEHSSIDGRPVAFSEEDRKWSFYLGYDYEGQSFKHANLFSTGVRISPLDVHNYDFHSILGQGGFGKVMLAAFANRKLAVKVIRKSPECNYNSIRIEASVLMMPHLNPFLCQGYSAFKIWDNICMYSLLCHHLFFYSLFICLCNQHHVFLVMDYLSGGSLAHHLDFYRSLEPQTVLYLSFSFKPDNILLDQDDYAKISDFGLAVPNIFGNRTISSRAEKLGYMTPEVLQRQRYNAAVDWILLGIIICQMASGDYPNNRDKIISSTINNEPKIPRWRNENLKDLLRKVT
ncbi:hypothetical protein XELAEV_18009076mg [Xenopus laevis]|uniref:Protein kinase domain-containing protein n=1 Tax=Xenopus laevis TaxID=8355 RepID=A0A974I077_XENLA|nr:hypothetical protein XELAEV_18009076mg [Xenopus laevis]